MRCELLEPVQSYGNKSAMWGVQFTHRFKNKNFNFVRIFALFCLYFCRILLTFCLKKCSYFQQKKGSFEELGTLHSAHGPPSGPHPPEEADSCPIELKSLDYRHVLYFRKGYQKAERRRKKQYTSLWDGYTGEILTILREQ